MLKIYTFPECPYCQELKQLLDKDNIKYEEVNVNLSVNKEEFNKVIMVTNSTEVPIIKIDKQLFIPNVSFHSIPESVELIKKFLN